MRGVPPRDKCQEIEYAPSGLSEIPHDQMRDLSRRSGKDRSKSLHLLRMPSHQPDEYRGRNTQRKGSGAQAVLEMPPSEYRKGSKHGVREVPFRKENVLINAVQPMI